MPRVLPETQHLPVGTSQETYRTSRRWLYLAILILHAVGLAVAAALIRS